MIELALLHALGDQPRQLLGRGIRRHLEQQPRQGGVAQRSVGPDLVRLRRDPCRVNDHTVPRASSGTGRDVDRACVGPPQAGDRQSGAARQVGVLPGGVLGSEEGALPGEIRVPVDVHTAVNLVQLTAVEHGPDLLPAAAEPMQLLEREDPPIAAGGSLQRVRVTLWWHINHNVTRIRLAAGRAAETVIRL
jgi:hypothetical protein